MKDAVHESGWYFAQDFQFIGTSGVGYIGLQPRPDVGSETFIHAVFSSFVNGSISQDANCHDGADGGPGVSCAVDLPGNYSNMYHLRVQNTGGTTWNGTLIDTVTGVETHIGSYTLPTGSLGIQGNQVGFVEWWPFNNGFPATCDSLSQTSVVFGVPTTSTEGAGPGELENAYEVYECAGKQDFKSQRLSDGVEVKVGFKKNQPLSETIFTVPWTVSNVTTSGLSDLSFPITVKTTDSDGKYRMSQSFNFGNLSYGGSLVFQPSSFKTHFNFDYLKAEFHSFVNGTTTDDKNCRAYNHGLWTRCSVLFKGNSSHAYHLTVHNSGGTTWVGTVTDITSERKIHIGSYQLPPGGGGITGFQNGYVKFDTERFQRPTASNCSSMPNMSVVFGKPITSVNSADSSDLGDVRSSTDCAQYGNRKDIDGVELYIHSGNRGDEGKNQDTSQENLSPVQPAQAAA
ncbi:hypothetical protein BDV39DRAFT_201027 [Aspergillus sergii]|uniref:Uncharacterized protein n=1 Tax=Aspergillus sergii TaxID=1034303 RepID=A0A5N6XG76_9EURO|nr:hypothetical protein BDV39DRAFT_201027 [Aspergillus sergii]